MRFVVKKIDIKAFYTCHKNKFVVIHPYKLLFYF